MDTATYDNMCRYAYQYGSRKYAASGAVDRFIKLIEGENDRYNHKNAFRMSFFGGGTDIESFSASTERCFITTLIILLCECTSLPRFLIIVLNFLMQKLNG
jgi:hypothetical protein